jgi:hypothetical protein
MPFRPALLFEEEAQAAAGQSADDASRNGVHNAAETCGRKAAKKNRPDASEDVDIRGYCGVELFVSHFFHSSFVSGISRLIVAVQGA